MNGTKHNITNDNNTDQCREFPVYYFPPETHVIHDRQMFDGFQKTTCYVNLVLQKWIDTPSCVCYYCFLNLIKSLLCILLD